MEGCSEGKVKMTKESNHYESHSTHKGGIRAISFIIGSVVLVALATNGPRPNLIIYLMKEYHMEMAKGSNMVFFWTAATYFTPLLAAILADTFTGRFWMTGSGIVVAFLGMNLLWLTTMIPQARPTPCNIESKSNCESTTKFQLFLLWASLGLISLGSGFTSASLSFGADQLLIKQKDDKLLSAIDNNNNNKNDNDNNHVIKRYINWFYTCSTFSVFVAYSLLVYIQDKVGWKVGFGIPVVLLFFSFLVFFLPSPFYVKLKAKSGWATELVQVVVAAYRKRSIDLSTSNQNYSYHYKEGSSLVVPTQKLRFFNRACLITNHNDQELQENGKTSSSHHDPWSLCTVDQVEDLKSVIKVIPLWFIGMLMEISMTQITILTLQAKSMNRKLGSSFQIPAGSFVMFGMLSVALWVPLYNHIFLPIASRIKGKPVYVGMKLRMGIGIFLACLSLVVNGITENIRRRHAITGGGRLSALCLLPQLLLGGFTESMFATAQYEFFYLELPRNMASTSSILFQLEYSVANLLSSLFMSITDDISKKGGKESWISSDINKGHYDYFFWVISGFCLVDLVLYLIWSKLYGPCRGEVRQITGEIHEEQRIPAID